MQMKKAEPSHGDILIVDDTPDNLRLLSAMLTRRGLIVRKALSGPRAIASVQADPPDLILLDIKMPDMSGYEVCQQLKADPDTQTVPIIFISALDDANDKVKAFAAGGVDYVTKPFQEAEVLARIENQLRLRRLQAQLESQNAELARSNRELEQFAHIVSHDLQQPLQSITGFAKLISIKHGSALDTDTQDYLNSILNAGQRMQYLIQDLLSYAQAGQAGPAHTDVDCNTILEQVQNNLRGAIAEKSVDILYPSLPVVSGCEFQLVQLFQNLISNAIKFTRPDVSPWVKVSAQRQADRWLIGIHDNGIGMPQIHIDRIFEAFQRLHDPQKYPGTGIGLATCKKIINNHQGQIWVESQLNVGTSFYFTLQPATQTNTPHHPDAAD